MDHMHGICPVMLTPLTADGRPNEEHIHRIVNFLVDSRVAGLWTLGSTGEDLGLTRKDRIQVVRATADAAKGRVKVITGTGLFNIEEILEFIEEIATFGVDGIHVMYMDHKHSDSLMIRNMTWLADQSPVPIWLYHNLTRGKALTMRTIQELSRHPNVDGMKVGGFNVVEFTDAVSLQNEDFQVIGAGGRGQCLTMLGLGATCHTTSDGCCWPDEYNKLLDLFHAGRFAEAREQQFAIASLNRNMGNSAKLDNGEFSAEEKYILSLRGICDEFVNRGYRTLTDAEKATVRQALVDYGFDWAQKHAAE